MCDAILVFTTDCLYLLLFTSFTLHLTPVTFSFACLCVVKALNNLYQLCLAQCFTSIALWQFHALKTLCTLNFSSRIKISQERSYLLIFFKDKIKYKDASSWNFDLPVKLIYLKRSQGKSSVINFHFGVYIFWTLSTTKRGTTIKAIKQHNKINKKSDTTSYRCGYVGIFRW